MSHRPALTHRRLAAVGSAIAALSDLVHHLDVTSPEDDVETCTEAAWVVYELLRDLTRPKPVTGCRHHPTGPIDPLHTERALPNDWGKCLLCNTNRRRHNHATRPTHT